MLLFSVWRNCWTSWTSQDDLRGRSLRRARRTGLVCGTVVFTVGSAVPNPEGPTCSSSGAQPRKIPGRCDREFHDVFLLFDATSPGDLRLQKEEVEAVFRLDLDDVEALYEKGSPPAREYAEGRASATRIHLAEFVPKEEGYLRRVAGAARRHLSGASCVPIF